MTSLYIHCNNRVRYEIMDGAPVKGESIPIRVFLAGYDVTPTMRDINKKFSVRYYLNLVLVDEEDRRYFKQQVSRRPFLVSQSNCLLVSRQEITLWRKGDRIRKSLLLQNTPNYHQVPHAMARHNPGDHPSANARTAPTPSEPNTPIAEHIPPVVNPPPTLPEDDLEAPSESCHSNTDHDEGPEEQHTVAEQQAAVPETRPPPPKKSVVEEVTEQMSSLPTNDDDDDGMLPPEDDSVPDEHEDHDAVAAVVDLDDDDEEEGELVDRIGNDDL